jgi:hypothetical protein
MFGKKRRSREFAKDKTVVFSIILNQAMHVENPYPYFFLALLFIRFRKGTHDLKSL